MPNPEAFWVVDRLEGDVAVLVADDGATVEVPRESLPKGCREGTVLRVPLSAGRPDWPGARIDEAERQRRLEDARRRIDRLGKSDPGGDITI